MNYISEYTVRENMKMNFRLNDRYMHPDSQSAGKCFKEELYPAIVAAVFLLALICMPGDADVVSPDLPPGMNTSIDPGDDFFSYANDHWIRENPVPQGKVFYSAFEEVENLVDERVRRLVEDAAEEYNASPGSPEQILGTFYRAALNDEANAETGLVPVQDELQMINRTTDRSGIRNVTSNLTAHGLDPFFVLYIDENPENRSQLIATIDAGDLTLRYAPFYLLPLDESVRVQDEMKRYVTSTFERQGVDTETAGEIADMVFRIEKRLAESELAPNESSNRSHENLTAGTYQVRDLNTLFPGINWESLFADAGRPDMEEVYIMNPGYVREVGRILSTEPVPDLQSYLTWRLMQFVAPFATPDMQEAYYRFYDSDLSQRDITPQKDRIFDVMDLYLGNPIAHLYVNQYFSSDDREKVEDIIKNMREVMRERVANLTWMSPETKKTALLKMDNLKEQAGYPDRWGEFHNLTLTDRSYLENMLSITSYFTNGSLQLSGTPSDPDTWYVSPHGVEAHYDLVHNRIVAPAGFLNPPFFDPQVDDAWNYGSFGWVYGHELIHMIDIGGQRYNPDGKQENWWTNEDANQYFRAAWPLIAQINATEVLPNLTLNGTHTLIETSADLGGITLAYEAYVRSRPDPESLDIPRSDGLTDRQRFFIAYAQALRGNITDDQLANLTATEDHPWNRFRANSIPFHLDAFYQAFPDINPGDRLYLNESERAHLW